MKTSDPKQQTIVYTKSLTLPEKVISQDRTPKGCQTSGQRKFTAKDLAPLRGATQLISRIPGGLRGLRPPATLFATLRVAFRWVNYIDTFGEGRSKHDNVTPGPNSTP